MATVIDFPARRTPELSPSQVKTLSEWWKFKPKVTAKGNPRNRYDAGFRAAMSRRAQQLISELEIATYDWPGGKVERDARINWVIAEIRKIREEASQGTPEHNLPEPRSE